MEDREDDPVGGFRLPESGAILRRRIQTKSRFGYAYERTVGYFKDTHRHKRTTLAKPRGASRVRFTFPSLGGRAFAVGASQIFAIPAGLPHFQGALTAVWDVLALYPSEDLLEEVGLVPSEPFLIRSTPLLDHLFDRLFYQLITLQDAPPGPNAGVRRRPAGSDLGPEYGDLLKLLAQPSTSVGVPLPPDEGAPLQRAILFIEANLFSPLSTQAIARAAGRSPAALFRDFGAHLHQTPMDYLRMRRFEEAAQLLESSSLTIHEICLMVGYEDVSSFSRSFKAKYGLAPSAYRETHRQGSGTTGRGP